MDRQPGEAEDALARAYRELQAPGSDACPNAEALAGLATGENPADGRENLADHVVSCRRCSESYQILARVHGEASRRLPGAGLSRLRWVAAAAIVLLGAGGVILLRSARREESFRGAVRESPASVAPADGATLPAPPAFLAWPAPPQAQGYHVKLFAADGGLLWEGDAAKDARIPLAEAARSRLSPGRSYFWTVEARMPLEKKGLGPFTFTLSR